MSLNNNDRPVALADKSEEELITRNLLIWLSSWPDLPDDIEQGVVLYETLAAGRPCIGLSITQATAITARYILGGHAGEYQFKLIYRIQPGKSQSAKLNADELLNSFGQWIAENRPDLGENIHIRRLGPTTRSSLFNNYENGDEDHQILLQLNYEVI